MTCHLRYGYVPPTKPSQEHEPYCSSEILPGGAIQDEIDPKIGVEQQIANLLHQLHRTGCIVLLKLCFYIQGIDLERGMFRTANQVRTCRNAWILKTYAGKLKQRKTLETTRSILVILVCARLLRWLCMYGCLTFAICGSLVSDFLILICL